MPKINISNTLFKYKWITVLVFLIFMALSAGTTDYIRTVEGTTPTFFEVISEQTNEPHMVLFPLMFVLLLFTMNTKEDIKNRKAPIKLLEDAFCATSLYMVFFVAANLLYCVLVLDIYAVFYNVWSYTGVLSNTGLTPLAATGISLFFLFMRFCFIAYLISFINMLTQKSHWGFWVAFIITYFDFMLYELLVVRYPWGILPLEHTRIAYTEAFVPDFDNVGVRMPYFVSVLYWTGLTACVYTALVFVSKRRRKHENPVR